MRRHAGLVPPHRAVEGLAEQERPVVVRGQVLVGVRDEERDSQPLTVQEGARSVPGTGTS